MNNYKIEETITIELKGGLEFEGKNIKEALSEIQDFNKDEILSHLADLGFDFIKLVSRNIEIKENHPQEGY